MFCSKKSFLLLMVIMTEVLFNFSLRAMKEQEFNVTLVSPLGKTHKITESKNVQLSQFIENLAEILLKDNNFFTQNNIQYYWYDKLLNKTRNIPFTNDNKNKDFITYAQDEYITAALKDPIEFFNKTKILPNNFQIQIENLENKGLPLRLRLNGGWNIADAVKKFKAELKNTPLKNLPKKLKNDIKNENIYFTYNDDSLEKPIILDEKEKDKKIISFIKLDQNPLLSIHSKSSNLASDVLNRKKWEIEEEEEEERPSKKQKKN